jgi:hypothetical protein
MVGLRVGVFDKRPDAFGMKKLDRTSKTAKPAR